MSFAQSSMISLDIISEIRSRLTVFFLPDHTEKSVIFELQRPHVVHQTWFWDKGENSPRYSHIVVHHPFFSNFISENSTINRLIVLFVVQKRQATTATSGICTLFISVRHNMKFSHMDFQLAQEYMYINRLTELPSSKHHCFICFMHFECPCCCLVHALLDSYV